MQPEEELLQAPHGDVEEKGQNGSYNQGLQQVSEEMKDGANDAQVIDEGVESHGKSNEPHGLGISGFWLFWQHPVSPLPGPERSNVHSSLL